MIIREFRQDEAVKAHALCGLAFGYSVDTSAECEMKHTRIGAFEDDGETLMAQMTLIDYRTSYCGGELGCVGIAGVSTYPQYRRCGCIRELFAEAFRMSEAHGWDVSFLYPFSFRYYRKFGYERIIQHKTLSFGIEMLDAVPRHTEARLYTGSEKDKASLLRLYNAYAMGFNGMMIRSDTSYIPSDPYKNVVYTFIISSERNDIGYVTLKPTDGSTVEINELVYDSADSLKKVFGFLRTYEGQYKKIFIPFLASDSPIEYLLNTDRMCSFGMFDGAMGRVINIVKTLEANSYPAGTGSLSLRITGDVIEENNRIYDIEYENGKGKVVSVRRTGGWDVSCGICTASRLLFGEVAPVAYDFLPELIIKSKKDVLADCFPKRSLNQIERF